MRSRHRLRVGRGRNDGLRLAGKRLNELPRDLDWFFIYTRTGDIRTIYGTSRDRDFRYPVDFIDEAL